MSERWLPLPPRPELSAACVEFALEGLWLSRRISKDDSELGVRYTGTQREEE